VRRGLERRPDGREESGSEERARRERGVAVVCGRSRDRRGGVRALGAHVGAPLVRTTLGRAAGLVDEGDAVPTVRVLAAGLERVPQEEAGRAAAARLYLRNGRAAVVLVGESISVAADAALALGRRVLETVAVEVAGGGAA